MYNKLSVWNNLRWIEMLLKLIHQSTKHFWMKKEREKEREKVSERERERLLTMNLTLVDLLFHDLK